MDSHFSIHGVSLTIRSRNEAFQAFASHYLDGFGVSGHQGEPAIFVEVSFLRGFTLRRESDIKKDQILGSGLGWDSVSKKFFIAQKELHAEISLSAPWQIIATFKKNFFRHIAHSLFFSGSKTYEMYYRMILRALIQQAVFAQLLQAKNIVAISAAAVKIKNKAYLYAGLPGSGKSSIINFLKAHYGAQILAENFVLTDGDMIFPFSEGKGALTEPMLISSLEIISHADAFVRYAIPKEQAYHSLRAINTMTHELPDSSLFAALTLVDPTRWQFLFNQDYETIKQLCERKECARLIVDKNFKGAKEYFDSL